MDSFKGSLSSIEAGNAVCSGILRVYPEAKINVLPLADGGEGTVEALTLGLGGELQSIEVTSPIAGQKVAARYGILRDKKTAIIEMAAAAGLTLLPRKSVIPFILRPMALVKSCVMPSIKAVVISSSALAAVPPTMAGWVCFRLWAGRCWTTREKPFPIMPWGWKD